MSLFDNNYPLLGHRPADQNFRNIRSTPNGAEPIRRAHAATRREKKDKRETVNNLFSLHINTRSLASRTRLCVLKAVAQSLTAHLPVICAKTLLAPSPCFTLIIDPPP